MPRKKQAQKLAIYDNNVKLAVVDTEDEIRQALRSFGYEAAVQCNVDIIPDQISYMAMKVEAVRGKHEVHHIIIVKE